MDTYRVPLEATRKAEQEALEARKQQELMEYIEKQKEAKAKARSIPKFHMLPKKKYEKRRIRAKMAARSRSLNRKRS